MSSTDSLSKASSGGALKLLDDLDELASLLGTDISKPRVWKSQRQTTAVETVTVRKVELGRVSSSKKGETFNEALQSGRLDSLTGLYSDVNKIQCRLSEAVEKQLINPDSAAFVNPDTQEVTDIHNAIVHGFIQKSGHYLDPRSGKRLKLKECLEKYIIVPRDVDRREDGGTLEEETSDDVFVPPLDLGEKYVSEVLDPATQEWISVSVAIAKGIYNADSNKYFNLKTGELLTSNEAARRNLLRFGDKLDSSMESTDTDVLLEGHIVGLKGRDINYSGAIFSDEEGDDSEPDDFLFSSSPRNDQSMTASSFSTTVVTTGSHNDMLKVIHESGEITPTFGSEDGAAAATPNNDLSSAESASSFVVTQSITTYEHTHQEVKGVSSQQQLMSLISPSSNSTVKEMKFGEGKMMLDESDSAILTANTSDVTLDLSNFTSADTTHEEVKFPTPPPPIDPKESEVEETVNGSATTSYQSSLFDESEKVITADAVTMETVSHDRQLSESGSMATESITITTQVGSRALMSSTPVDSPAAHVPTTPNSSRTEQTNEVVSPLTDSHSPPMRSPQPVVNVLLQKMHKTLSSSEPPASTDAKPLGSILTGDKTSTVSHPEPVKVMHQQSLVSVSAEIVKEKTTPEFTLETLTVAPDAREKTTLEFTAATPTVAPDAREKTNSEFTPKVSGVADVKEKKTSKVTSAASAIAPDVSEKTTLGFESKTSADVPDVREEATPEFKLKTSAHILDAREKTTPELTSKASAYSPDAREKTTPELTSKASAASPDAREKTTPELTSKTSLESPDAREKTTPELTSKASLKSPDAREKTTPKSPFENRRADSTSSITSSKSKLSDKITPNLFSSLSKHLEEKTTTIKRNEPKHRSASETYRRPVPPSPSLSRKSDSSSPSLKQLSQQLAMEAVQQRESFRSREGLTVSGLVKPSQRLANWKELEKKSKTPEKLIPAHKLSKSPDGNQGNDKNNNVGSTELLAKVDAALENIRVDAPVTQSPSPVGNVARDSTSGSERAASRLSKSPDGPKSKVMEEVMHWNSKEAKETKITSRSPSKITKHDPTSPSKVAFTYDPTIKKHKVTVYQHATVLSYEIGVKLGLVNIKTGRFRDPSTGSLLSVRDACLQGLIDDKLPAITDIQTGRVLSLKECVDHRLIDLDTGRVSETVLKSMRISVSNFYVASLLIIPQPINILDAVKVGLLNPHTGQFFYTLTKDRLSCTLEEAVNMRYISGEATLVQDPNTQKHYYLGEAVKRRLVNGKSGDIVNVDSGLMYMTFYGALLCGVYKSVYDITSRSILHPSTGHRVSINEAIETSLLGHDSCLVYDSDQGKQVSFDEALAASIVDRASTSYVDRKTGASIGCEKAVELGLIEPIGAEVCSSRNLSECVETLYTPPSDAARVEKNVDVVPEMTKSAPKKYRKQPVAEPEIVPVKKEKDAPSKIDNAKRTDLQMTFKRDNDSLSFAPDAAGPKSSGVLPVSAAKTDSLTPLATSTQSVVMSSKPADVSSKAADTSSKSADVSSKPAGMSSTLPVMSSKPADVSSKPADVSSEPAGMSSKPAGMSSKPVVMSAEPTDVSSKPTEVSSTSIVMSPKPVGVSTKSVMISSKQVDLSSKPAGISSQPAGTSSKPSVTSSKPAVMSAKLANLSPKPALISPKPKLSPKPKASDINSTIAVTERVIEIESKKRPQLSAHPDNISATEYFTKGDVELEISTEDESAIDSYEVKLSDVEPKAFDWEALPISPLKERTIVVESKERAQPLRDKEIIIIEKEDEGITIDKALETGCVNCETKEFTHPVSGHRMSIDIAIQKGFLAGTAAEIDEAIDAYKKKGSVMEYKMSKEVEYMEGPLVRGIPFREAVNTNRIDMKTGQVKDPNSLVMYSLADAISLRLVDGESAWFTSPSSKRLFSISEAIANNVMDSHGFWSSQLSGLKKSLAEGVAHGYVKMLSPTDHTHCMLTIVKKFSVHYVIHPVSMEKIDYNLAVLEGVVNTIEGIYKSPATGDSLSIEDAISKGLICGALLTTRTRRELLPPEPTFTEKRCYTITHAKDTLSGKNLTISEARAKGILDEDLTTFKDLRNGSLYSIQEAIDNNYLVATLDDPSTPSSTGARFVSTKVHKISSVVNPKTNQMMPANEAVKEGIIDEDTGDYVNLDEDETMNMNAAIQKGLVKTRPAPTPVTDTPSFSITAITNPNNGELMTVADALRHGYLDRGKKHFCNPSTRTIYSLIEAINNGWVHVKSNTDVQVPPATVDRPPQSAPQTFTIISARNVKLSEDVAVSMAVSQGILDSSRQRFMNNFTGEVMTLDQAVKRGFIKLMPTTSQHAGVQISQPIYQTVRVPTTPVLQRRQQTIRDGDQYGGQTIPTSTLPHPSNTLKVEPVYSQVRRGRNRHQSGPTDAPQQSEPIDIYKANSRGLITHQTGEVTVPQYGTSMLIDDALLQGLISTKVPMKMLMYRPFDPSAFAIFEAFQRGFVNPVTLAVRHPATGQFMSMESALSTGLLHPRAANTPVTSAPTLNAPPTLHASLTTTSKRRGVRRADSMGKVEGDRRRVQRGGTIPRGPLLSQSQEYHNYTSHGDLHSSRPHNSTSAAMTLTNNRTGAHLVNGKLYSTKYGHIINSNGQVVNLMDGEVTSLAQAEKLNLVRRLADGDHQSGQSYVPASNLMFNRDPVPFPTKTEAGSGLMVMHVRNHQAGDSMLGDNVYSTLPSNIPVNGSMGGASATLPSHLRQIDDHYAEIRH